MLGILMSSSIIGDIFAGMIALFAAAFLFLLGILPIIILVGIPVIIILVIVKLCSGK